MFNKKNHTLIVFLLCLFALSGLSTSNGFAEETPRLGVWITVFSSEKVLHTKENVDRLIKTCLKTGINDIYIQIYRADKAYYNSDITDKTPYKNILAAAKEDTLTYLIAAASGNNLKIHAWLNMLSIAQNKEANILKKFGEEVLTKDQHGRTPMPGDQKDSLDKYYIRENQLFLEPGDNRVRKYLADIAEEVVKKYPGLSGLHLDYIRYPAAVPFIPGSRFTSHGISYGYGEANVKNFANASGINIRTMKYARENFRKWDTWRRDQITTLVENISKRVRRVSPTLEISSTIVPSPERTYLITLQDWTRWLAEGYIDHIVAMNYTDDTTLMKLNSRSLLMPGLKNKVHIGMGAYLLKKTPGKIRAQLKALQKLSPAGIVIFSYDDVAGSEELQKFLADNFKKQTLPISQDEQTQVLQPSEDDS